MAGQIGIGRNNHSLFIRIQIAKSIQTLKIRPLEIDETSQQHGNCRQCYPLAKQHQPDFSGRSTIRKTDTYFFMPATGVHPKRPAHCKQQIEQGKRQQGDI